MKTAQKCADFRDVLRRAKAQAGADFEWYRYDSLASLAHARDFLTADLEAVAREKGVLDLGCGDGDLSFYFESLGCAVTAVDHPAPNHNGMRGVRLLRRVLDSRIELREADVDTCFPRFERRFGLTLLLGVLYHLKNPFYVLDNIARISDYCIMSTRIARNFPKLGRIPDGTACAYLLAADELNQDNTNFWIFSAAGLDLLLKRSGWRILAEQSAGDTIDSDAVSLDRDERKFCLLRSRHGFADLELLYGWHEAEAGGWRWTERVFSIRTGPAASATLEVYLPPEVLSQIGAISMAIATETRTLATAVFEHPGRHTITRALPPGSETVTFSLDKALPPDSGDCRERGLIVAAVTLL
jgi:tRNA (mo5U34)-methyltransferase